MPQLRDAQESELLGGRVLMMASGAVDLATGLSARITETPVRPAVARGWRATADVMADDGWYDELPGSRPMVCVDAWLTRTWSGRWRALRVLVPATASSRSRIGPGRLHGAGAPPGSAWATDVVDGHGDRVAVTRVSTIGAWLHLAAQVRAAGAVPVHASSLAYLNECDAAAWPALVVAVPSAWPVAAHGREPWQHWLACGGRLAALVRLPSRRMPACAPTHDAGGRRGAAPAHARAGRQARRAWLALDRAPAAPAVLWIPPSGDRRTMTHLELLDVSARLDQERDDQAACTLACRLVCLHAEAAHAVVVSRRGEAWCAIGADGDPGETAAALPHLCRPGAPDQVAGAQGWHVAQPVDEGGATVGWLVARWPTQAQARSGVDLLAAFARLVATRVVAPRLPCADPGLEEVLVGSSGLMHAVRQQLTLAARAPFPVLIRGESGCGKELAARAIHRLSARRHRRCAAINCAALPDDLVESELFGHVRGAFTGAATDRAGLFDDADGGTLFLDEVAELGARAQAKLLRVLQDGEVRRVGETQAHRVDVRVIAATNVALDRAVQAGTFRADLFYRLDVVRVHMPALRERREDIPQLTAHLWRDYAARVGCRARLDDSVVRALARHDWPGNVRELQNTLAALAVNAPVRGRVTLADLSTEWRARESNTAPGEADEPGGLDAARRAFDATFVREALCRAGGRPSAAARDLGLTRQGLTKLVRRLGLNPAAIGSRVP